MSTKAQTTPTTQTHNDASSHLTEIQQHLLDVKRLKMDRRARNDLLFHVVTVSTMARNAGVRDKAGLKAYMGQIGYAVYSELNKQVRALDDPNTTIEPDLQFLDKDIFRTYRERNNQDRPIKPLKAAINTGKISTGQGTSVPNSNKDVTLKIGPPLAAAKQRGRTEGRDQSVSRSSATSSKRKKHPSSEPEGEGEGEGSAKPAPIPHLALNTVVQKRPRVTPTLTMKALQPGQIGEPSALQQHARPTLPRVAPTSAIPKVTIAPSKPKESTVPSVSKEDRTPPVTKPSSAVAVAGTSTGGGVGNAAAARREAGSTESRVALGRTLGSDAGKEKTEIKQRGPEKGGKGKGREMTDEDAMVVDGESDTYNDRPPNGGSKLARDRSLRSQSRGRSTKGNGESVASRRKTKNAEEDAEGEEEGLEEEGEEDAEGEDDDDGQEGAGEVEGGKGKGEGSSNSDTESESEEKSEKGKAVLSKGRRQTVGADEHGAGGKEKLQIEDFPQRFTGSDRCPLCVKRAADVCNMPLTIKFGTACYVCKVGHVKCDFFRGVRPKEVLTKKPRSESPSKKTSGSRGKSRGATAAASSTSGTVAPRRGGQMKGRTTRSMSRARSINPKRAEEGEGGLSPQSGDGGDGGERADGSGETTYTIPGEQGETEHDVCLFYVLPSESSCVYMMDQITKYPQVSNIVIIPGRRDRDMKRVLPGSVQELTHENAYVAVGMVGKRIGELEADFRIIRAQLNTIIHQGVSLYTSTQHGAIDELVADISKVKQDLDALQELLSQRIHTIANDRAVETKAARDRAAVEAREREAKLWKEVHEVRDELAKLQLCHHNTTNGVSTLQAFIDNMSTFGDRLQTIEEANSLRLNLSNHTSSESTIDTRLSEIQVAQEAALSTMQQQITDLRQRQDIVLETAQGALSLLTSVRTAMDADRRQQETSTAAMTSRLSELENALMGAVKEVLQQMSEMKAPEPKSTPGNVGSGSFFAGMDFDDNIFDPAATTLPDEARAESSTFFAGHNQGYGNRGLAQDPLYANFADTQDRLSTRSAHSDHRNQVRPHAASSTPSSNSVRGGQGDWNRG